MFPQKLRLIAARDEDFAWMQGLGGGRLGLRLAPGGLGDTSLIAMLRAEAAKLRLAGHSGYWLGVAGREVVGLCGYKSPPDEEGAVDFGYGIAESRRRRGHGTAMVEALARLARRDRSLRALIGETAMDNTASHTILARAGFDRVGFRLDHDDGPLIVWRLTLCRRRLRFGWTGG